MIEENLSDGPNPECQPAGATGDGHTVYCFGDVLGDDYQRVYLRSAQSGFRQFEDTFWSGVDLNSLYREITQRAKENGATDG